MGKSRNFSYQCGLCLYTTGRKWNAERHDKLVHKGIANMLPGGIAVDRRNLPSPSAPLNHLTFFDKDRRNAYSMPSINSTTFAEASIQKNTDFIGSVIKGFESDKELLESFGKLMRPPAGVGWNCALLPSSSVPPGWSSPNYWNAALNSLNIGSRGLVDRILIGYRSYVCEKCYRYGVEEFGLQYKDGKPVSFYGGICEHSCIERPDPQNHDSNMGRALYQSHLLLLVALSDRIGAEYYLHIAESPSPSTLDKIPEQLNHIDFGQVQSDDILYSAIKDGRSIVKLTLGALSEFVKKVKASYCLATFEDGGKKRQFFLVVGGNPADKVDAETKTEDKR